MLKDLTSAWRIVLYCKWNETLIRFKRAVAMILSCPMVGPRPCQFDNLGDHNLDEHLNYIPVADAYSGAHKRTLGGIIYKETQG